MTFINNLNRGFTVYQSVNFSNFRQAFRDYRREDQFSNDALQLLFDWYENYEDGVGSPVELDVIGICCDWSEMTAEELESQYPFLVDWDEWREYEDLDELVDALNRETSVAGCTDSTVIFMDY